MFDKFLYTIFHFFNKNKKLSILIVMILLALVLYPRFDMQDISLIRPFTGVQPGQMTPDQQNYYYFTEYFKGNSELGKVWPPFSYRPLMPFIASLIPTDSMLSMSIVNVIANLLTLLIIYYILKKLGFAFPLRISGMILYIISFPLLYYGSSGFLEPTANLFIYLIVYLTVSNKTLYLPFAFILASLAKEATIITLPFSIIYLLMQNRNNKNELRNSIFILTLSSILFIATNLFVRSVFATNNFYIWAPSSNTAIENLRRAKTYLSFILGFGFPGLFSLLFIFKYKTKIRTKEILPWVTGMIFALLLAFYSVVAAYSDGRFIWMGYPFMIVLTIYYFEGTIKEKYSNLNLLGNQS